MKIKSIALFLGIFAFTANVYSQYKDLDGVFFGKVIALGAGGGITNFTDKSLKGAHPYYTPLDYTVIFNNKRYTTVRFNVHVPFDVVSQFQDWNGSDYTQTSKFKLYDIETNYRFGLTADGMEKPFSVFISVPFGLMFGKQSTNDSRYGDYAEETVTTLTLGGGAAFLQRLGSRFVAFAEPSYRFSIGATDIYLGENNDKLVKFSRVDVHVGIMYLIGKNE
jgi:hypothetical protein